MVEATKKDDMVIDQYSQDVGDDGWEDDNDEWDEDGCGTPEVVRVPSSNAYVATQNYKTMHVNEIRTALSAKLEEATELYKMDTDDMMIIIRHYKWNNSKMEQNWFDQSEQLKYVLGLEYNKQLDKDPQVNVSLPKNNPDGYCLICYEYLTKDNKYNLACGHTFCISCVREHLFTKI